MGAGLCCYEVAAAYTVWERAMPGLLHCAWWCDAENKYSVSRIPDPVHFPYADRM